MQPTPTYAHWEVSTYRSKPNAHLRAAGKTSWRLLDVAKHLAKLSHGLFNVSPAPLLDIHAAGAPISPLNFAGRLDVPGFLRSLHEGNLARISLRTQDLCRAYSRVPPEQGLR